MDCCGTELVFDLKTRGKGRPEGGGETCSGWWRFMTGESKKPWRIVDHMGKVFYSSCGQSAYAGMTT